MSGIVALVRTDGSPVDERLLARLTDALRFRGPDRSAALALGSVGLGHALLASTPEAEIEAQPLALGRGLWLTGDVRIDARDELRAALAPHVRCDLAGATDPELVLHAYRVWEDACVEQLLGDFAFVVRDERRRRIFCARDPFGVKLLYYARVGRSLLISNTLGCLRAHPDVSSRLDPGAVGDLLLHGEHQDRGVTVFADVRAVPAGHTLSRSDGDGELRLCPYWQLPEERSPESGRGKAREALEEFRGLLDAAVADRLRTRSAAVFMSGGLDSPMVASRARTLLGSDGRIEALTLTFDRLIPDRERGFSAAAARHLRLPIHHFEADGLYRSWDWMRTTRCPEPQIGPHDVAAREAYAQAWTRTRVILTGWDGDSLLAASVGALWRARLARGELRALGRELGWHLRAGRLPRVGLRAAFIRRRQARADPLEGYPDWLNPEFERAQALRSRWRASAAADAPRTPRSPARAAFASTVWRTVLDPSDAGMAPAPIEQRHPLIDLRIVRFALALPAVPWCVDKHLFRSAMFGELPDEVLRRPKEPLRVDPLVAGLARMEDDPTERLAPELGEYVDVGRFRAAFRSLRLDPSRSPTLASAAFTTCVLSGWLDAPVRRTGVGA